MCKLGGVWFSCFAALFLETGSKALWLLCLQNQSIDSTADMRSDAKPVE